MSYSKLAVYANDPFWVRLRYFCFGVFWCAFVVLLASAVVLILTAPRCRKREWWQEGPMYGIFAHDFRNDGASNADGIAGTLSFLIF
jgi:solute carrier family 3 protein 2